MPIWDEAQLGALSAAVQRARSGEPTLLVIEGAAGTGKTTLLNELGTLPQDFRLLSAEGLEYERFPFSLLAQWGIELPPPSGAQPMPFVAAQAIRRHLDELPAPHLLVVEDLHWSDPESVARWPCRSAGGLLPP